MNKKNTEKLLKKYPKLLRQFYLTPQETCLCWGFECGDGWFDLIDTLFDRIVKIDPDIEVTQCKQKFGALRVYLNKYNENINELLDDADKASRVICEACGSLENVSFTRGWVRPLCEVCMSKGR
jgi:hypothetical protein